MPTLKESAQAFSGKKEIYDLAKIPLDIEFKTGTFKNKEGKDMSFTYIEVDSYKYTLKSTVMQQIKDLLITSPNLKHVKVVKSPKGELIVMPLD